MRRFLFYTILLFLTACCHTSLWAQYQVRGTVLDSSRRYALEAVSVLSTNGRFAITDSLGRYRIEAGPADSVWFSYLGKPTPKYPVAKMVDPLRFDIALQLRSSVMREVKVRSRLYKEDSVQNRKDYAKAFDFRRPNIESMTSLVGGSAGIDLQELIRVFQFRKNRSMERFRERLLQQEREKFIDHRFSKALVRQLTGLNDPDLDRFMQEYRPSYAFAAYAGDYDFQLYIKNMGAAFKSGKPF